MTSDMPAPGIRSANQRLLAGPALYLRPVELADAATAAIWRRAPFPAPVEVIEEQLRKQLQVDPEDEGADQTLIVCRRVDDLPIGSLRVRADTRPFARLSPNLDMLQTADWRDEITAELVAMTVPWLIEERNYLSVILESTPGQSRTENAIASFGGRRSLHLRERFLVDGKRVDSAHYQMLSPRWVDLVGAPPTPTFGKPVNTIPLTARLRHFGNYSRPPVDAFAVGERICLRPFDPAEGALVARWSLEEPEVSYNEGRTIFNPVSYGHLHTTLAQPDMPSWIRFAIALRESGELIGCLGLHGVDWVQQTAETETEIFRPEYRGSGYGTEAKHLLLEYAFDRLGLHMVYSFVGDANIRSAAALRKQGYRDAGYLAWLTAVPGGLRGYWAFDLLASEWRASRNLASKSLNLETT